MAHFKRHIPGPVEVSEKTFRAFCSPMIGHRGQGFKDLYASIQPRLQQLFQTRQLVYLCTSSAWGVMEGAIRNLVAKKVLNCCCGAFSDKWFDVSKRCGKDAEALKVEWGTAPVSQSAETSTTAAEYEYVGLMHFHAQQYDNALRSYRSALRYRNSWHLQNNIGSVFLARGEAERAMAHFNIGHTMNPRQAVSTFNMGNVFVQKRNMSAALGAFSQAIAVNPRFDPAYLNKGLAHWHLQEYDSALVYMECYVEMERDPSKTATVRKDIEYLRNATRSAPSSGAGGTGRHP